MELHVTWMMLTFFLVSWRCSAEARISQADNDDYPVRLVGGASEMEGRVEILFNGRWGTVCDRGWGPADASVVCRQLGFYGHNTSFGRTYFGVGWGPKLMIDVGCHGSENYLTDCPFTGWGASCPSYESAGVACQSDPDYPIRLIGGISEMEGTVEIFLMGEWGNLCSAGWKDSATSVVCRQLGFYGHNASCGVPHSADSRSVVFTNDINCRGHENSLADCARSGWGTVRCGSENTVKVFCQIEEDDFLPVRLIGGITNSQGILEVYFDGQWSGVLSEVWDDADTSVACRQLGFSGLNRTVYSDLFDADDHRFPKINNVIFSCTGKEQRLADCTGSNVFNSAPFAHLSAAVGIVCQAVDDHPVRLVDGASSQAGRVEIYLDGHWAAVCARKSWDRAAASVVCRQLGYSGPSIAYKNVTRQANGCAMDDVQCSGLERNLSECTFPGWGMIQIRPLRAAFVKCEEENNFPVRLVDGSSNTDGVVEIFFNDRWGKVCSYGWDSADASVVCRQLGFHGLNVSVIYNRQSQTVDYLMNVDCTGDEAKLADCGYNGWNAHCFKYAGVMCQMAAKEYPVRLIGGNSSTEGIVEILFNGQWVNVSSNEWDDAAAGVVCRQLGLHGPSKAVIYLHTPSSMQGSDGVFLEDVRCNGDEQRLADCFYARWGIEQFFSNERLGVICSTEHYSVFPIRLIGGLTPKSGLIQLFYLNQWGVVCDENWSEAEAKVVCRQLGFEGHSLPTVNSVSWQFDSDPVYQTSFHCLGDEESLTSCMRNSGKHRSSVFCYQKIGVVCQESVDFYPIRLAGGLSYEAGRIEVYFQGYWGIIQDCSDTNNWGIEEANVACNQLGFNGARASVFHSIYGDGTGLILMESVDCSGNETQLADCSFPGWGNRQLLCHNIIGVICKENFEVFGGTCPPPEAVPRPNGQPTIDVIAPLGQSVASVFWTKPTLVLPLNHSTESSRCVPADADSSPYPCQSGSSFNITSQFAISHGRDTAVQYVVTDLDEVDSNFKCTFFVSVRDDEKPTITCPDNITKVAEYGFQYITANWTEPVGTDNSDIVSTISNVPHSPPIQLGFGIHVFTYTATDGSLNTNFCTFAVTVKKMKVGSCPSDVTSDATHGLLTWPVTEAGSHAESYQRCPIYTEKAGWAKAVRHCTFDNLASSATWEAPQILSCGENRSRVTVEDVAQIPISRHNVLEVAKFLAEKSYKDWSTQRIDAVVEILNNITRLGPDGEPNVTNAVIDTVDNIAKALATFEQSQYLSKESLVSMLRTVQKHVSATLARKGVVHIQKDSIHVEAVSANLSWARNGLSFILEDGLTSEQRGSTQAGRSRLVGSEVRVYGGEVLQSHSVRAAVTLPGNMVKRLPERDGNTSLPHMNVSFIIYADDTMFPSAFVKGLQSGNQSAVVVPGPVISLAVEDVTLVNLSEPVVIEFETVASSSTESATCVFWDFTLEGGVGDWSSIGCEFQGLTNGRYTCLCNHEAIFAVLVELGEEFQTNRGSLDLIAQISCIGSTSTYLIVIIVYLFLRKARAGKAGHVFPQFLFSLLMIYAVFLAGVDHAWHLRSGCVVVAALLHYLPLATLMWTAVEVRHIYNSMLHGSSTDSSSCVILTSLVAWASPLIVTGITVTLALDHYGSVDSCLLVPGLPLYLGFLVPVGLILTHNTITTIAAVKVNFCSAEDGLPSSQVVTRLICGTLTWVLFLAILCFGFLLIYSTRSVFSIVFSALNFAEIVVVCTLACVHRTKETPISGTQKGPQEGSKEEDEEDKDDCSEEETPSSLSNAVKSVDCQGTRVTSHTEIALEEI